MSHHDLTKQALVRLNAATPSVKVVNGTYHVAEAVAKFSNRSVHLTVEYVHPSLEKWHRNPVTHNAYVTYFRGYEGFVVSDLPDSLTGLVEKLRSLAVEQANKDYQQLDKEMQQMMNSYVENMVG